GIDPGFGGQTSRESCTEADNGAARAVLRILRQSVRALRAGVKTGSALAEKAETPRSPIKVQAFVGFDSLFVPEHVLVGVKNPGDCDNVPERRDSGDLRLRLTTEVLF